jgi:hypothetical protein
MKLFSFSFVNFTKSTKIKGYFVPKTQFKRKYTNTNNKYSCYNSIEKQDNFKPEPQTTLSCLNKTTTHKFPLIVVF